MTCDNPVRVLDARTASERTGRGIRVGVVDSGWNRHRTEPRVLTGVQISSTNVLGSDDHDRIGHGTTCARILLELAPDSRIVPIRVFERELDTSPDILIAAIEWAVADGLKLLNLSLGTLRVDVLRRLYATCERARRAGVILVAAARSATEEWSYPAVFEPVIGVGLTQLPDPFMIQYREGAPIECATSSTERLKILTQFRRAAPVFGTSYAAPIVTGVIARWLEEDSALDVDAVRTLMASR